MIKRETWRLGYSVSKKLCLSFHRFTGRVATIRQHMEAEVSVVSGGDRKWATIPRPCSSPCGDYSAMQITPSTTHFLVHPGVHQDQRVFNWTRASQVLASPTAPPLPIPSNCHGGRNRKWDSHKHPAGINCPGTCSASFASGKLILAETPTTAQPLRLEARARERPVALSP